MAAKSDPLAEYRKKRDFRRTGEPCGDAADGRWDGPIFVIQKHRASSLHYDFRLEVDGVLKSWAVPKGPSTDPREKRLAVMTEDHPLEYAGFEGVIPEGEYGAGTVLVWDAGVYRNVTYEDREGKGEQSVAEGLEHGFVEVCLEGEKIKGRYRLIHAKLGGQEKNWLLVKGRDDHADARRNPVSTEPESVLSGRTIEQIAEKEDPVEEDED